MFAGKPSAERQKQQAKEASNAIKKEGRSVDRELNQMRREETKLTAMIKEAARRPGGQQNAKVLAKQLVRNREQQARLLKMSGQMSATASQVRSMGSQAAVAGSMASAASIMGKVNAQVNPAAVAATMQELEKQSAMMGMKEEMVDDAMEALDDEWGDEDDDILAQVMDEIGLEQTAAMQSAPARAVATGAASAGGGGSRPQQGEAGVQAL
ncbi:vacuolar protein sorting protein 2B [Emiliania huxleyi CCMP1516]|uniref:Uncharacterized protein n=2 Tax=Emiliania huxleyi TaxID=2903 RepID=A0A0D3I8T3_EMIH1|nr:vacuolar protein sorting protein 2B [Emiliania huxleyi CCMP1516]EOD07668.1 vacuolar protein sorting protein 2B [Emiliania huxleyi CCMP1516]|eukprot:XP_005760097.1 vacuolar protein sorting protein 2B [Emiliania huxleyi CCMP1516]